MTSGGYEALASVAGSVAAGAGTYQSGATAAKRSYEYSKRLARKFAQKGPSWNVYGLKKAGLNPILAAGMNTEGASLNVPPGDYGRAIGDTVSSALSAVMQKRQNQIAAAEAREAEASADEAEAHRDIVVPAKDKSIRIRSKGGIDAGTSSQYEPSLMEQQIRAAVEATRSSAQSNTSRARLNDAMQGLPQAQINQINNAIKNNDLPAARKLLIQSGLSALLGLLNAAMKGR